MFKTLASCWNKERLDVFEAKYRNSLQLSMNSKNIIVMTLQSQNGQDEDWVVSLISLASHTSLHRIWLVRHVALAHQVEFELLESVQQQNTSWTRHQVVCIVFIPCSE